MSYPAAVNRYTYLLEGLTLKRVALVTFLCVWAAAAVVWFFANTYLDLLVSALCVGYTSMVLFTVATNLREPPPAALGDPGALDHRRLLLRDDARRPRQGPRHLHDVHRALLRASSSPWGWASASGAMAVSIYIFRERESRRDAELARAQAERAQLEKNVLQAQLALMQAQVEPHFLFNTLANVQHLVETDPASASRMLESLIQYLRAALPQMREDRDRPSGASWTWPRPSSTSTACAWARGWTTCSRCPRACAAAPFPPMMLITLVENAVIHGVDPCCEAGTITIRATRGGRAAAPCRWRTRARASRPRRAPGWGSRTSASG